MKTLYYLNVDCITCETVLGIEDIFKCDKKEMEDLVDRLTPYNLFNKMDLLGFDDDYPERTYDFIDELRLDRQDLILKESVPMKIRAYIFFLSCLIAKKTHFDMYRDRYTITDFEDKAMDKIITECIDNYKQFNILDYDDLEFITDPDKVNKLIDDLKVLDL